MKTIRNVTRLVGLAVVAALMFVPRAGATTISITPPAVSTTQGSSFSVDVIVSGLTTTAVGGASFLVSFDDSLIKGTTFTLDPDSKMGGASILDFGSGFTGAGNSPFEAFFIADATLDNTALLALQGSGFRLATLNFNAVAVGTTGLNLSFEPLVGAFLSNADGFVLPADSANACVTVNPRDANLPAAAVPCGVAAVPEPATFGLLATGLATVLARRRRKSQGE
jgi:PEP-CTERM motif-containing protein